MLQIYYGNGKGKTSAAVGSAIRAAGADMKVLFVQFFKNGDSSEIKILKSTKNIHLLWPKVGYSLFEKPEDLLNKARREAYNELLFYELPEKFSNCDMLILDEVIDALKLGVADYDRFLSLITKLKDTKEIILTGHYADEGLFQSAEYISEIKEIKHPYKSGVSARKGIEY